MYVIYISGRTAGDMNKQTIQQDMAKIKNIIFDFGGVIYDVCYENVAKTFAKYGIGELGDFYSRTFQTPEIDQLEVGEITAQEFRDYVKAATGNKLDDAAVDDIFNSMLLGLPRAHVELLLALKSKYRLFLFSNTNEIHCDYFRKQAEEMFSFDVFDACFDACYFSHIMHKRKPHVEGFLQILQEQGLVPSETLFVDDIAANLEGAARAGIRTYHLHKEDVSAMFDENLCLVPKVKRWR